MEILVLGSEMKEVDTFTINKIGIPTLVLMERAALSVYEETVRLCDKKSKILIVCGIGNNGADGLALSRMLSINDFMVSVYIIGNIDNATQEFKKQLEIIKNIQVLIVEDFDAKEYNVIVDAIFGIGLSREIKDKFYNCIYRINNSSSIKIAIDIPSGLCADTGKILAIAVKADYTVTFGKKKTGLLINNGVDYSGKIIVKDIGFPSIAYNQINKYYACNAEDLKFIPKRNENSNKGTFGKLLIIAGSKNMSGAAYLSAKAAYRMGTGLVQILSVNENREILQTKLPEAVLITYDLDCLDFEMITNYMNEAKAIVIGPGLGRGNVAVALTEYALKQNKQIVIDADSLNVISENPKMYEYFHNKVIITPHVGEMSRLTKLSVEEIKGNLINTCIDFAKRHEIVCVLKDAKSVISNGSEVFINTSGNSGMATAGSGDVLTGVIGGLLAIGTETKNAAVLGTYIHGFAGDIMADKLGKYALMATDIINGLSSVLRKD